MQYTNWFAPQRIFLLCLCGFFSAASLAQPTGLIDPAEGDRLFLGEKQVEVYPEAIQIEVSVRTSADSEAAARELQREKIEALSGQLLDASATIVSSATEEVRISRQGGIMRLNLSGRRAESDLRVAVGTDKQLLAVLRALQSTEDVEIAGYEVIYPQQQSDEQLTTELTNEVLREMQGATTAEGQAYRPRGFTQLEVNSTEIGREQLEALLEGDLVEIENVTEKRLTIPRIEKQVKVELAAY